MGSLRMITYTDILEKMKIVLVDDITLWEWCEINFNSSPKIFIGIDDRNPPGKKDCPLIILRPSSAGAEIGQEQSPHIYKVLVDWAILDETVNANDNLVEYQGVYEADNMGQLIWQALKSFSDNVSLSRSNYILEPISYFPMIVGGMDLEIIVPNVIGAEITL